MILSRILFQIFLACILFSSCAYFNTFHNTKKLYKQALKEQKKRKNDRPTSQELRKYDLTIEKASKILQVYPESKYVDDALMILGECFYYKADYVKAERKFQELVTFFPQSDYLEEAKVWLAKTKMELQDYSSTKAILSELLLAEKLDRKIREQSQLLLGESLFKQNLFTQAQEAFRVAAEDSKNKEYKAKAYFQLGECQTVNEKHVEAVGSFEKAIKFSQDNNFEFEARLKYANALILAGEFRTAKQVCNELLDNEFYKDKYGLIKLAYAKCIYHEGKALYNQLSGADLEYRGKISEAIDEYKVITLDHKSTDVAATAYFLMAKIYLEEFGDFAKAKENFDNVQGEFRKSEYSTEARRIAKNLGDLIKLNNAVKKAQGEQLITETGKRRRLTELQLLLLEHGNHPELRFLKRQADLARIKSAQQGESGQLAEESDFDKMVVNKLQLAEVYLFQFGQVDSAVAEYNEIITFFPDHPGAARALFSTAFIYENEFHDKAKTDSLLTLLIDRFPNSMQAQEARSMLGLPVEIKQSERAEMLYREAELKLFAFNEIESALAGYQNLAENHPDSEYAPKALFAMGWIHEEMNHDNDKAVEIYKKILDKYPESAFAAAVKKKIEAVENEAAPENEEAEPVTNGESAPPVIEESEEPNPEELNPKELNFKEPELQKKTDETSESQKSKNADGKGKSEEGKKPIPK